MDVMSSFKRHIPYLPYHKSIIREICTPQKDDLLIIAKGLGMRRVSWQIVNGPSHRNLLQLTSRSSALF
jgi:hypothetical protein